MPLGHRAMAMWLSLGLCLREGVRAQPWEHCCIIAPHGAGGELHIPAHARGVQKSPVSAQYLSRDGLDSTGAESVPVSAHSGRGCLLGG